MCNATIDGLLLHLDLVPPALGPVRVHTQQAIDVHPCQQLSHMKISSDQGEFWQRLLAAQHTRHRVSVRPVLQH